MNNYQTWKLEKKSSNLRNMIYHGLIDYTSIVLVKSTENAELGPLLTLSTT